MPDGFPEGGGSVPEGAGLSQFSMLLQELARAPGDDLHRAWQQRLRPGDAVGRFEILREIGRGGFGVVYEALDRQLGRSVAFKTLRPARTGHELSADWILKEAEAVARLDHPAVVTLYDVGRCESGPYLVEELLRGETLEERLHGGPLPTREAVAVGLELARGLAHAHGRGVLHRDLKPGNVFLTEDGRVKLLDFGLAHLLGTRGMHGAGTPAYMAPEQQRGEGVDARADVFALGATLFEALVGKSPFLVKEGRSAALDQGPPPALPEGTPTPLAALVERCLSRDPARRPASGQAVVEELLAVQRALDGQVLEASAAPVGIPAPRRGLLALLLTGLVVIVAGGAYLAATRRSATGPADGRVVVAVADFANETSERELDSLSGLLITTLEQSSQLRVLTRSRMFDVLRQLGKENVERIDEPLAREVGRRTGTRALLLATIRRLGDSYVVDMRALDPVADEYLFTVRDRASGKDAVFDLVDRLGGVARQKLTGADEPEGAARHRVASITTGNVKAWDHLFRARQAMDRYEFKEARKQLAAALEADPEFALAHYERAVASGWEPEEGEDLEAWEAGRRRHRADALRFADRLPEKERLSLLARKAYDDYRLMETMRLFDRVAEAYPLDKEALLYAGDIRFHTSEAADSIPFFDRALELDPSYALAAAHLADALARTGRADQRLAWLRRQVEAANGTQVLQAVARAFLAAGKEAEAVDAFKRASERGGNPWPPPVFACYLAFTGRAAEAEAQLRAALARPGATSKEHARFVLAWKNALAVILVVQGRIKEARALFDELKLPPIMEALVRLRLAEAVRSADAVRAARNDLLRLAALWGVKLVPQAASALADGGDPAAAGRLASSARANPTWEQFPSTARRLLDALAAWGSGSRQLAEEGLRVIAGHPEINIRYAGFLLLGHLASEQGDCAGTVAALEQARSVERGAGPTEWNIGWYFVADARIWTHPHLLQSLALCYERMGDLHKARERNDELLQQWKHADPDLPLLAEAKALEKRLASAGAVHAK